MPMYDPDKFRIGGLCKRGHSFVNDANKAVGCVEFGSLRYRSNGVCVQCSHEHSTSLANRERRRELYPDRRDRKLAYDREYIKTPSAQEKLKERRIRYRARLKKAKNAGYSCLRGLPIQ